MNYKNAVYKYKISKFCLVDNELFFHPTAPLPTYTTLQAYN